jgi:hypothetical protein
MVDCFVTSLQLAQVLLYEMDAMQRSDSSTLWMRHTRIDAAGPPRATRENVPLTTSLTNTCLLEMDGGLWRTSDIIGQLGCVQLRCAVAHMLPTIAKPGESPAMPTLSR